MLCVFVNAENTYTCIGTPFNVWLFEYEKACLQMNGFSNTFNLLPT